MREKLIALAARELDCKLEEVHQHANELTAPTKKSTTIEQMIELAVNENRGSVFHPTVYEPEKKLKVTGFVAQVAEVEVDPATGAVKVLRLTTAHDTGVVLNHLTLTGQIDGGVITGLGLALMEENSRVDGRIVTLTLGEAKLPGIADVPPLKTILVESPTGPAPFGAKSIAENPNAPTAAAIANAIADACGIRLYAAHGGKGLPRTTAELNCHGHQIPSIGQTTSRRDGFPRVRECFSAGRSSGGRSTLCASMPYAAASAQKSGSGRSVPMTRPPQ